MRKFAIIVALASTALATSAFARNDAWYIGVEGGPSIVEDISLDIGALNNAATVDHKTGYDVDGIIGYDFGGFRLESEVGYKTAGVNNYSSITTTAATTASGGTGQTLPGTFPEAGGKTSVLSFMVNALLDFGDDDGLSGFVGGGIGVARVKADYALNTLGAGFLDDSDTGLAYQALAGVRAPLTDHWDVGLKYRFFNADHMDLIDRNGRANSGRYRSHSLLGSLIYNFGEPAAPPPPPMAEAPTPPPPPPPVVEAPVCTPGPYIVFFEWDKSDITAEAGSILDNAVSAYGNCGQAQVMLAGHADKSGTPKYNIGLSQRRNTSVRSYLEGKGIPGGVISNQAFGEGAPRVETADGVRELQNRRVEITYGPGSGQ
jgi:OmpA-OmpF porin, OOP family